jgi:ABC-2 type transport system permease protein
MSKNVFGEAPEQEKSAIAVRIGEGVANQQTLRNIGLIIGREFKNRVTQRSFRISTIIILVLIVAGACVPTLIQYFSSKSNAQTKIAVINSAGAIGGLQGNTLTKYIQASLNGITATSALGQNTSANSPFAITAEPSGSVADLRKQVKNDNLDILLIIDRTATRNLNFTYYTHTDPDSNDTTLPQIQAIAQQLNFRDQASQLGLTPAQTGSLFTQSQFMVINTQQNQDTRSKSEQATGYVIAYAGILLIFMSVYIYGVGVAMGVAEEKGNRIMEILANAATPFQLMVGKILGLGAAGLLQMACFVAVGIGAFLLQTPLKNALLGSSGGGLDIAITGTSITLFLLLLVYFILGFLLYATLFAAMGALVKRQDEVQNTVQPITWLFMIGYISSIVGISGPNATWVKVISYIPFWTPTTMLMRIGVGVVSWWEIVLTIILMIVAIFVCALISARIYRFGILMYGQKPSLRQLAKLVR